MEQQLQYGWFGEATIKSWAKQTEESYQLQLALALRLSSQAASADDPNFLDFNSNDINNNKQTRLLSFSSSAETISHRFWVCFIIKQITVIYIFLLVFVSVFIQLCFLGLIVPGEWMLVLL